MAASEKLTNRVREALESVSLVKEKKMFSGVSFMVNDKMCINIGADYLMVRIDPTMYQLLLEKEGCSPVVMKGREIKGFVYVDEEALVTKKKLAYWIDLALEFNPKAKRSKK